MTFFFPKKQTIFISPKNGFIGDTGDMVSINQKNLIIFVAIAKIMSFSHRDQNILLVVWISLSVSISKQQCESAGMIPQRSPHTNIQSAIQAKGTHNKGGLCVARDGESQRVSE
jgi:hypothetical protein